MQTNPFDSRGYTVLTFVKPTLDGVNQPSLNDRTDRGDDVNARLLLIDNTGAAVSGVQVSVVINGTSVSAVGPTDASGVVDLNLTVPFDAPVGFHDLNAEFVGTPGTTGLVGDNATVRFVVLGETNISITESSATITAGDTLYVNGTLVDDLGLPLQIDGVDSIAVVYLLDRRCPCIKRSIECIRWNVHVCVEHTSEYRSRTSQYSG